MATIPNDPEFVNQWHLRNLTEGEFDLNVVDVWDDYTGDGVRITVVDSGFDVLHPDFMGNYDTSIDFDYANNDTWPNHNPPSSDPADNARAAHGTSVVGIIAAMEGNGIGGVGVAWDSSVNGYSSHGLRASYRDTMYLDAAGLGDGVGNTNGDSNGADIITNSGGLGDNVFNTDPDIADAVDAYETVSEDGRDGLGTILVKSSGNSRGLPNSSDREEGTAEAHDSTKYMINVAAVRADGWVTDFSTPGANVLVSAFADDTSNNGAIVTTDLIGTEGANSNSTASGGDYRDNMGGTSSAAPQVAGVIALMLEANPNLGWRDVQEILAYSARHVGSEVGLSANAGAPSNGGFEQGTQATFGGGASWFWNAADNWNGGGLHFSNDYGFGLVDAKAAVRLAETWRQTSTSSNDIVEQLDMDGSSVTTQYTSNFTTFTANESTDIVLEHVNLNLNFTIDNLADMEIFVTSPGGTRVQLINDTGDTDSFSGEWDFGTVAFMGERSAGTWTVEIRNDDGSANGAFESTDVDLFFSGSTASNSDLLVFTNEYSDYASVAGHGRTFHAGSGVDILNASAVDSNTTINLLNGSGTIDGVAVTVTDVEIVYAGDGNDTLVGNSITSELHGGRGNDTITGGGSNVTVWGGDGNDTLIAGDGNDVMFGEDGMDIFRYAGGDTAGIGQWVSGGDDFDRIEITGSGTVNLTELQVASIEGLLFASDGSNTHKIAILSSRELDENSEFATDLFVFGNNRSGSSNTVIVNAHQFNNVDLSGWQFASWNGASGGNSVDLIRINGDEDNNTIVGTSVDDIIAVGAGSDDVTAGDGDDEIFGFSGNDTLRGNAGNDTIYGEDGVDTLIGGAGDDWLSGGLGLDDIRGGSGVDTADYTYSNGNWTIDLDANGNEQGTANSGGADESIRDVENLTMGNGSDTLFGTSLANRLEGGGGSDNLRGRAGNDQLFGEAGNDDLQGGTGGDSLVGGAGNDVLSGGADNDFLFGSEDDDVLSGNAGDDMIDGGDGVDAADYSSAIGSVDVDLAITDWQYINLWEGSDRLSRIENLNGSAQSDTLRGDDNSNAIYGLGGDDEIEGRGGNEVLNGGMGSDTASYESASSGVTVDLNLSGTAQNTQGAGIDTLISFENLRGSDHNDLLSGDFLGNVIDGEAGDDILFGRDGDDRISGGAGNDFISGGAGNDILDGGLLGSDTVSYIFAIGGVVADISTTDWQYTVNAGFDRLYSFENLSGSLYNDTLTGNAQANEITGGNGFDIINGGSGNDILNGGADGDALNGGLGSDTASYRDAASGVSAYLTQASSNTGEAAGDTYDSIENMQGSAFDDTLVGDMHSNRLDGGAGADTLGGEDGDDIISGGAGNDWLYGGAGSDTLNGGDGNDVMFAGGIGYNMLGGDAGEDILISGYNSDWMWGGSEADRFQLGWWSWHDHIVDFQDGLDRIDLSEGHWFGADWWYSSTSQMYIVDDANGDAFIALGANTWITIYGVSAAQLDDSDFIFA